MADGSYLELSIMQERNLKEGTILENPLAL